MDGGDDTCGFECNICLALAQDPVITPCGHLYCWSCLMKWLFKSHSNNECPVCRAEIELSQLIFSNAKLKSPSDPRSGFECNICSQLARDPIVTLCGHLYCWTCLNKWLHKWNSDSTCWVCKDVIKENKLVPLYGKGTKSHDDVPGPGSWSVPAGIAGTALSLRVNRFIQLVFATIGAFFQVGRRTMEIFMTRVLPVFAILVMLHPSLPRERKMTWWRRFWFSVCALGSLWSFGMSSMGTLNDIKNCYIKPQLGYGISIFTCLDAYIKKNNDLKIVFDISVSNEEASDISIISILKYFLRSLCDGVAYSVAHFVMILYYMDGGRSSFVGTLYQR